MVGGLAVYSWVPEKKPTSEELDIFKEGLSL
jgi:hypothetical protein